MTLSWPASSRQAAALELFTFTNPTCMHHHDVMIVGAASKLPDHNGAAQGTFQSLPHIIIKDTCQNTVSGTLLQKLTLACSKLVCDTLVCL